MSTVLPSMVGRRESFILEITLREYMRRGLRHQSLHTTTPRTRFKLPILKSFLFFNLVMLLAILFAIIFLAPTLFGCGDIHLLGYISKSCNCCGQRRLVRISKWKYMGIGEARVRSGGRQKYPQRLWALESASAWDIAWLSRSPIHAYAQAWRCSHYMLCNCKFQLAVA